MEGVWVVGLRQIGRELKRKGRKTDDDVYLRYRNEKRQMRKRHTSLKENSKVPTSNSKATRTSTKDQSKKQSNKTV